MGAHNTGFLRMSAAKTHDITNNVTKVMTYHKAQNSAILCPSVILWHGMHDCPKAQASPQVSTRSPHKPAFPSI